MGHSHQTNGVSHCFLKMTIVLAASLLFFGCAGSEQAWKSVKTAWQSLDRFSGMVAGDTGELEYPKFSDGGLRKVLAVGAVRNIPAFAGKGLNQEFQDALVGAIGQSCREVVVLQPGQSGYPQQLPDQTDGLLGGADSFPLTTFAGGQGINAVLVGGLTDFRKNAEERGMLWFRDTHYYLQILASSMVYDTETGAKLLDKNHQYQMEVDLTTFEMFDSNPEGLLPMVMEGIKVSAKELGGIVCEALDHAPWSTRITEVREGRIVLAAGSAAGLTPGRLLDVLETTEIVPGPDGRRFSKPGGKIGTIRVSNVLPDRTEAEIVDGSGFQAGNTVRVPK